MNKYEAIIIGSGPNGLAAAIYLQQKGLSTAVYEKRDQPGGAVRTLELTSPGFLHDIGSTIHPLAYDSPFFSSLPLEQYGLKWIFPDVAFAHPLENGDALGAFRDIEQTSKQFDDDYFIYHDFFSRLVRDWDHIKNDLLGPLSMPASPVKLASFGLRAIRSAKSFVNRYKNDKAKIFFYGAAAHSMLPLHYTASASFGLVLIALAHKNGWPFPQGGAGSITRALVDYYKKIGGDVYVNHEVKDLRDLPASKVYLLDQTPKQLMNIKGTRFTNLYRHQLNQYKYGIGIYKIDWSLNQAIPFKNEICRRAGTLHFGFTKEEILKSEKSVHHSKIPDRPYVLLAQNSVYDKTRAPENKHIAWAYCHVPLYDQTDMTDIIERQIERSAPGFRDCILERRTHHTGELEAFNPNLVGGDINGGKQDITQMFTRPVLRLSPYTTPDPRIYICSSSTPPGGGVHGMCGYHSARIAYKNNFR